MKHPHNERNHMSVYRHGDVLIVRVEGVPGDAVKAKHDPRGLVLAEGEVTGHHHRINAPGVGELLVTPEDAQEMRMWLHLDVASDLTHEEHHTINLPAGDYEIIKQVEYQAGELINVAD